MNQSQCQNDTSRAPKSTDELISVWLRWDAAPSSQTVAVERVDAVRHAGIDTCHVHERIAAGRRAGMSIPDAVQAFLNDRR